MPSGTYACYNIRPGKTQIAYYNDAYSEIILDTFAGKSYYIKVQLKSPSIGNNLAAKWSPFVYGEFTIIDEVEGQKLLSECSVIDWSKDEGEKK